MKKLLAFFIVLTALGTLSVSAMDLTSFPAAVSGSHALVNAGVGFGSARYGKMSIPPLTATVDIPLALAGLPFSFGGMFGFTQSRWTYWGNDYLSYNVFVFGGRANYHINFGVNKLDTYAGLTLGWEMGTWGSNNNTDDSWLRYYGNYSAFHFGFQAGARYFFTNNIGAFAELGYGLSYVKAGLALKF
ncbi:MAG: hypothetical protein LBQ46_14020 [Treponema sp.]|nr:hypothetical protein [Treponema sp.]